jgi:hypothetical protein
MYNEFYPKGDAGGNKVFIRKKDNAKTVYSLHQYWDNLPGGNDVSGKTLIKQGDNLKSKFDAMEMPILEEINPFIWMEESHRKCAEFVYAKGEIGSNINYTTKQVPPALSKEYQEKAAAMADRQLYIAGKRTAMFISRLKWYDK